jgi:mannose-6-phosphate isomerase class I
VLADCKYFRSELIKVEGEMTVEVTPEKFISLTVISGKGSISVGEAEYSFEERDSIFIPAGDESYFLRGNADIIKTTV